MNGIDNRTNVVALIGGLGNQIHQVAFAAWLERETGIDTSFDVSFSRRLELDVFDLPGIGDGVRARIIRHTRYWPSPDGRAGLGRLLRRVSGPRRLVRDYVGPGIATPLDGGAWWFGYWQRTRYTPVLLPAVGESLIGPRERLPYLGVHVRRGDMLRTPTATPAEWYRRGVDLLRDRLGALPPIRVLSDDLPWCREYLDLGAPFELAAPGTPVEHMAGLARCSALVIPRSSFSWWAATAATLAGNVPVVYPGPWWPALDAEDDSVIPDHWMRVPVESERRNGDE